MHGAHSNLYSYNLLLTCVDMILSNTKALAATYRNGLFLVLLSPFSSKYTTRRTKSLLLRT